MVEEEIRWYKKKIGFLFLLFSLNLVINFSEEKNLVVVKPIVEDNATDPDVSGMGSIGIGDGSKVSSNNGLGSIAIGYKTEIKDNTNSVAIGGFSKTLENSTAAVSIGANSYTYSDNSIALGYSSTASVKRTGTNALFSNEEISENGVLSIGHKSDDYKPKISNAFPINLPPGFPSVEIPKFKHESNLKRQIINVAGGVDEYDAVNVKQLSAVVKALGYSNEDIVKIYNNSNGKLYNINERIQKLENNMNKEIETEISGISNSVAMSNLPVNIKDGIHSHTLSASYGNYGKNHSFSLGISGQGKGVVYKASMALNTKLKFSAGLGLGYTFYSKEEKSEIEKLKDEIKELKEMIKEIKKNK